MFGKNNNITMVIRAEVIPNRNLPVYTPGRHPAITTTNYGIWSEYWVMKYARVVLL